MEPRESTFEPTVIGAIWRYRALFGAIVAACIVLGVVFSALQPKEWSAVATLVVEDPRASSLFEQPVTGANADRYVENQVAVLRSQTIAQEVIGSPAVVALADPMDLTEFAGRLTVGSSLGSDVLTVGFIAGDPDVALASVNAVTEAYQSVLEDEATSTFAAAVEELGTSIERWRSDLDQIQADIAEFTASDPSRALLSPINTGRHWRGWSSYRPSCPPPTPSAPVRSASSSTTSPSRSPPSSSWTPSSRRALS